MAKQIIETVIDDIDGGNAAVTVQFAYDGKAYEIDLNKKNAKRFDDALEPWVAASRRISVKGASARKPGTDRAFLAQVRVWAAENGMDVSARGRVAQTVLDAYRAAH